MVIVAAPAECPNNDNNKNRIEWSKPFTITKIQEIKDSLEISKEDFLGQISTITIEKEIFGRNQPRVGDKLQIARDRGCYRGFKLNGKIVALKTPQEITREVKRRKQQNPGNAEPKPLNDFFQKKLNNKREM